MLFQLLWPVSAFAYDLTVDKARGELTLPVSIERERCPSALSFFAERLRPLDTGLGVERALEVQLHAAECNAEKVERWQKASLSGLLAGLMLLVPRRRRRSPADDQV